jgi:hypothetical protein
MQQAVCSMHQQQLLSPLLEPEVFPMSSKYIAPSLSQSAHLPALPREGSEPALEPREGSVPVPGPREGSELTLGPREGSEPASEPREGSEPAPGPREGLEPVPFVSVTPSIESFTLPSPQGIYGNITTIQNSLLPHEGEGVVGIGVESGEVKGEWIEGLGVNGVAILSSDMDASITATRQGLGVKGVANLSSNTDSSVTTTGNSSLEVVLEQEREQVVEESTIINVINHQITETVFGLPLCNNSGTNDPYTDGPNTDGPNTGGPHTGGPYTGGPNPVGSHTGGSYTGDLQLQKSIEPLSQSLPSQSQDLSGICTYVRTDISQSQDQTPVEAISIEQVSEPFHPPALFLPFHLAAGVGINVDITIEAGHHKGLSSCDFVQHCLVDRSPALPAVVKLVKHLLVNTNNNVPFTGGYVFIHMYICINMFI